MFLEYSYFSSIPNKEYLLAFSHFLALQYNKLLPSALLPDASIFNQENLLFYRTQERVSALGKHSCKKKFLVTAAIRNV